MENLIPIVGYVLVHAMLGAACGFLIWYGISLGRNRASSRKRWIVYGVGLMTALLLSAAIGKLDHIYAFDDLYVFLGAGAVAVGFLIPMWIAYRRGDLK